MKTLFLLTLITFTTSLASASESLQQLHAKTYSLLKVKTEVVHRSRTTVTYEKSVGRLVCTQLANKNLRILNTTCRIGKKKTANKFEDAAIFQVFNAPTNKFTRGRLTTVSKSAGSLTCNRTVVKRGTVDRRGPMLLEISCSLKT